MNLQILRRTAAELTAAAVFEMFPEVELLGGGETSTGFVYDFHFPHPINPDTISLIEERMRQIVREKRPIRVLEMVPYSASELLKQEGHWARAEELEEAEGLVEVFQMGSFHDLCVGSCAENSGELAAFKLLSVERVEEEGMRVAGAAHFSKDELKEFLRKLDDYEDSRHMKVGEGLGFWMRAGEKIIWLEPGLKVRNQLIEFLKERLFEGAAEVSGGCHEAVMKQLNRSKIGEVKTVLNDCADAESGLFEDLAETQMEISFNMELGTKPQFRPKSALLPLGSVPEQIAYAPSDMPICSEREPAPKSSNLCKKVSFAPSSEEDSISLLQSIDQTLNMLGFHYCLYFMGRKQSDQKLLRAVKGLGWEVEVDLQEREAARIDFRIEDGIGRNWTVAQVRGREKGFFMTLSVEKILALLVETNAKSDFFEIGRYTFENQ